MRPVIGIVHGDEIACRVTQASVTGGIRAAIDRVPYRHHTRIAPGGGLNDRPGIVAAAVINDNKFQIRPGLVENALHGNGDRVLGIVRGHQHADLRFPRAGMRTCGARRDIVDCEGPRRVFQFDRRQCRLDKGLIEPAQSKAIDFPLRMPRAGSRYSRCAKSKGPGLRPIA